MTKYVIEFEEKDGDGFINSYYDLEEAENIFDEIINENNTISATLTEYYIYGGICQGEKVLKEFTREEK